MQRVGVISYGRFVLLFFPSIQTSDSLTVALGGAATQPLVFDGTVGTIL